MVAGVESSVEVDQSGSAKGVSALELHLLGQFAALRDGRRLPLPSLRKVRALLACLALSPRAVTRGLDEPERQRVLSVDESVRLDLSGDSVDVLSIDRPFEPGIGKLGQIALQALAT